MAGDGVRSNKKPFKRSSKGNPNGNKVGPKPKYSDKFPQMAMDACGLKATDSTLAIIFDVAIGTIHMWKRTHPEFASAVRQGKLQACMDITGKMQKAAEGYYYEETVTGPNGTTTMRKYAKPCPTAAKLLLAQRMPEDFGDTSTRNTIYANNLLVGGDVNDGVTIDAGSLTADQLRAMLGQTDGDTESVTIDMETGEDDE